MTALSGARPQGHAPRVEPNEAGVVACAQHHGLRELARDESVHQGLRRLIERRGGLVEHEHPGTKKERAPRTRFAVARRGRGRATSRRPRRGREPGARGRPAGGPRDLLRGDPPKPGSDSTRRRAGTRGGGRCAPRGTARQPWGTSTQPDPNGQMPDSTRRSVVLPDPAGPVRSTRSPAATSNEVGGPNIEPLGGARGEVCDAQRRRALRA